MFLGTIQSVGSFVAGDEILTALGESPAPVLESSSVKFTPIAINFALFLGPEELVWLSINSSNATWMDFSMVYVRLL